MRLVVISFKECWPDAQGRWHSSGGFPLQMAAIASLFNDTTILITQGEPRSGGIPLPAEARIVALRRPHGTDTRRKLSVIAGLTSYLPVIANHVRRADVVHVPLPGDLPFLGLLTALFYRKHLIARYGGSWRPTGETTTMNRVTRGLLRRIAGGRNVVFATGEGGAPPASGAHWIFASAISREEMHDIRPNLERSLSTPPRAIAIGRLSPEKGFDRLVSAVARLKRRKFEPIPTISFAGEGPERAALAELIRAEGCVDCFQFLGQLDRPGLTQALALADFAVQPSLTEGFSKAWLDAMASGLPVLASGVGAAAAVVGAHGERGWLTRAGDIAELTRELEQVLRDNRDWPALRRRCRAFAEGRTLEAWAAEISQVCSEQWGAAITEGWAS